MGQHPPAPALTELHNSVKESSMHLAELKSPVPEVVHSMLPFLGNSHKGETAGDCGLRVEEFTLGGRTRESEVMELCSGHGIGGHGIPYLSKPIEPQMVALSRSKVSNTLRTRKQFCAVNSPWGPEK